MGVTVANSEVLGAITKRRSFKELERKENQRYEYSALVEYPFDFSDAQIDSIQSVVLKNKTSGEKEQISFKVSHNVFFPNVKKRQLYGMVETDDGYYAQIEFNIMEPYFDYESSYNRIVVYLRTPPVFRFSPRV